MTFGRNFHAAIGNFYYIKEIEMLKKFVKMLWLITKSTYVIYEWPQGRELQNSKLREEYKKAQSKLAEVEKNQSEMQEEITGLESKLEKSIQNCDQYKCEIDGKVFEQIPEKFNELQADCSNEIKVKLTTCLHKFFDYESTNF